MSIPPSPPSVSILILNTRQAQQTVRCVQAYVGQTIADQCEILVIDNHSEDDSIGVLRNRLAGFSNVRIIENPDNLGFGGGYNRGAHYARGKYLLINNPDKIMPPDGVERLVQKIESDAEIGILAPALVHDDDTHRLSPRYFPRPLDLLAKRTWLGKLLPRRVRRYLQLDVDPMAERRVDWVAGGCILVPKSLFEQLKGFDERFFLFFEDIDFCRRCAELGRQVLYYPTVQVRDRKRRLSEKSGWTVLFTRVGRAHAVSCVKYFWKWGV